MFTAVFSLKHRTVLHSNRQRWTKLKLYLLRRVAFKSSFMAELMLNPLKLKSMKRQIVAAEVTIWEQD